MDIEHFALPSRPVAALEKLKALIASRDPRAVEAVKKANLGLLNLKLLTPGGVHIDQALQNLSIQYKNEDYIGDKLMPLIPSNKLSNKYFIYNKRDRLGVPDDEVTARSVPNEINETARTLGQFICKQYALVDFVDGVTLDNEDAPLDEMADMVAAVNDAMDIRQEIRIANAVQNTANYTASTNTSALAAAVRWDSAGGGDPARDIYTMIDALWMGNGPTKKVGWTSPEVWRILRTHPRILDVTKYTKEGFVPEAAFADKFGLDEFHIGRARQDTANVGQTANYGRIWGKNFGVLRVARSASIRIAAWGFTFMFGQKQTTQWYDPHPGMKGGYYAKVGQAQDHRSVAPDTGYLMTTVIS